MGLVVARESPRALQSRVVRRGRKALGCNAKTSLVERRPTEMGWQRRTRLQSRFQTQRSHGSVYHESGGRGANLWATHGVCRWRSEEHTSELQSQSNL